MLLTREDGPPPWAPAAYSQPTWSPVVPGSISVTHLLDALVDVLGPSVLMLWGGSLGTPWAPKVTILIDSSFFSRNVVLPKPNVQFLDFEAPFFSDMNY